MNQLEDPRGDKLTKNAKSPVCCRVTAFQRVHVSNVPPHFSHPKPQVSSEIRVTNREPLQESLCISVTASQSLKARKISEAQDVLAQLQVCMKGLLKSGTIRGQEPIVKPNGSSKPIELQRFMCTLT